MEKRKGDRGLGRWRVLIECGCYQNIYSSLRDILNPIKKQMVSLKLGSQRRLVTAEIGLLPRKQGGKCNSVRTICEHRPCIAAMEISTGYLQENSSTV